MINLFKKKNKPNQNVIAPHSGQFHVRNAKDLRMFQYNILMRKLAHSGIMPGQRYDSLDSQGSYKVNSFIIINPQDKVFSELRAMIKTEDLPMLFGIGSDQNLRISFVEPKELGQRSSIILEVPKPERYHKEVRFGDVMKGIDELHTAIGVSTNNKNSHLDYSDPSMSHTLVGGVTGSGKSNTMKVMNLSTLHGVKPGKAYTIIIDVEKGLSEWGDAQNISHLACPIVTNYDQAVQVFSWLMIEKAKRYERNQLDNEAPIYVYIDELSILLNGEEALAKMLADLHSTGRGAKIYFVAGTQNGNKDALGGDRRIKDGMTTRIIGSVNSPEESKYLTGRAGIGAESLQEKGDFILVQNGNIQRVAVPLVRSNFWDNLPQGNQSFLIDLKGARLDPNNIRSVSVPAQIEDVGSLQAAKSLDKKLLSLCMYIENKQGKPMGATQLSKITKKCNLNGPGKGYSPNTIQEYQKIAKFIKGSKKEVEAVQAYFEKNPIK